MIYFLALLPATALTIGGYFVLYLANKSEGGLKTFGKYLGFWAFALAGLVVLGAIFAAAHGPGFHRFGRGGPGYGFGRMGPGSMMPGVGPGYPMPRYMMPGFMPGYGPPPPPPGQQPPKPGADANPQTPAPAP